MNGKNQFERLEIDTARTDQSGHQEVAWKCDGLLMALLRVARV